MWKSFKRVLNNVITFSVVLLRKVLDIVAIIIAALKKHFILSYALIFVVLLFFSNLTVFASTEILLTWINGQGYNTSTGVLNSVSDYTSRTDYISVNSDCEYTIHVDAKTGMSYVLYFDENKNFISSTLFCGLTHTFPKDVVLELPENTAYIAFHSHCSKVGNNQAQLANIHFLYEDKTPEPSPDPSVPSPEPSPSPIEKPDISTDDMFGSLTEWKGSVIYSPNLIYLALDDNRYTGPDNQYTAVYKGTSTAAIELSNFEIGKYYSGTLRKHFAINNITDLDDYIYTKNGTNFFVIDAEVTQGDGYTAFLQIDNPDDPTSYIIDIVFDNYYSTSSTMRIPFSFDAEFVVGSLSGNTFYHYLKAEITCIDDYAGYLYEYEDLRDLPGQEGGFAKLFDALASFIGSMQNTLSEKLDNMSNGYEGTSTPDANEDFNNGSSELAEVEEQLTDVSNDNINDYTDTAFDASIISNLGNGLVFVVTWFTNFWNMGGLFTSLLNVCLAVNVAFFILRIKGK